VAFGEAPDQERVGGEFLVPMGESIAAKEDLLGEKDSRI